MQQLAMLVDKNVAWLTIKDEDCDVAAFVTSFVNSINYHLPNFGSKFLVRLSRFSSNEIFRKLADEFRQIDKTLLICIDDFHLLDGCAAIESGMEYLLSHLPPGVTLVLTSRTEPSIRLERLVAEHRARILRERELAFTSSEIKEYLRLYRIPWDPTSLDWFNNKIQGWPACLALAADHLSNLNIMALPDVPPNKETIYRYFSQELLGRLTEELRNFIIRSSLMDEIDVTLAGETLHEDKAAFLLNKLEHQHIPLSHSGEPPVYRYHPLFLGFLRIQAENSA